MDENKIVTDLIKLYGDNSGYFKDALDQAQTAMYISSLSIIVSLFLGWWNNRVANKALEIQKEKVYREIITKEKTKALNDLRNAFVQYLSETNSIIDLFFVCSKKKANQEEFLDQSRLVSKSHTNAENALKLQLHEEELGEINLWISDFDSMMHASKYKNLDEYFDKIYKHIDTINVIFRKILEDRWKEIEEEARI